jgi:hypothetical protein
MREMLTSLGVAWQSQSHLIIPKKCHCCIQRTEPFNREEMLTLPGGVRRPDAGGVAELATGNLCIQGGAGSWREESCGDAGGGWGIGDTAAAVAGCGDNRPAAERAALRDAAQHHEGQEEAHRPTHTGGALLLSALAPVQAVLDRP